ncbi:MAG: UDP-N-acetylmuramoyl-tripeptide--D-alanyl-D-alanine ligase, partial [Deltaproteobacteria bacterium]|nr:UDP-N-acetylmuramoyl-tripeptide--D-alanyl-D-alanine ligase [Deltaproteobacteria bacterium]
MATELPRCRARFLLSEIARVTGGQLVGEDLEVRGVATDTRGMPEGALFVALRGPRFDGHRFVSEALEAGASAALVQDESALAPGQRAVLVADTLRALGDVAAFHRRRMDVQVVAITGSAGKTSTKELLADALAAGGRDVLRTRGNLNNRIGLPLTLLALEPRHEIAVIEMGTSEPGEIARLTEIARPDVGVLTLVAAAHTEGLGSLEAVAAEKG